MTHAKDMTQKEREDLVASLSIHDLLHEPTRKALEERGFVFGILDENGETKVVVGWSANRPLPSLQPNQYCLRGLTTLGLPDKVLSAKSG